MFCRGMMWRILTVGDTLEVVVGLCSVHVGANEFEIDFILHVAHQNESCDDTWTLTGLHGCANLAVPDVVRTHQQGTNSAGCHGEENAVLVLYGLARGHPVCLATISQVSRVCSHCRSIESFHAEIIALAYGCREARLEVEGVPRVASTKTVCADTTLSVLRATRRVVGALAAFAALGNVVGGMGERRESREECGRISKGGLHVGKGRRVVGRGCLGGYGCV